MLCQVCSREIREEARFCSYCGHKISIKKIMVNFEIEDKSPQNNQNSYAIIDEENNKFIEKETVKIFKEKAFEIDFPDRDCSNYLSKMEIPPFKGLRGRQIRVTIPAKDIGRLMEKEKVEFRDGFWKKDFEGLCALCSLEDTMDMVYHCIKGQKENKFCCELHGYLIKHSENLGIYSQFVFPEKWDNSDIDSWKKDITKSEEERKEKTLEYYKTGMMDKSYCCNCDKEIPYVEHFQNSGFCEDCKSKEEVSESEKIWQLEISKYKIGSIFRVELPSDAGMGDMETGQMYQLKYKKGKRVYMTRLDLKGKQITGKGDWFLGIPPFFKYQRQKKGTKSLPYKGREVNIEW